jgi:hypothetical protein
MNAAFAWAWFLAMVIAATVGISAAIRLSRTEVPIRKHLAGPPPEETDPYVDDEWRLATLRKIESMWRS